MKHAAIVRDGRVANLIVIADDADPADFDGVAAASDVRRGWLFDGQSFSAPPVADPLEGLAGAALKAALRERAGLLRWQHQTGGITVSGVPVRTDDKTRTEIALARADAALDPAWTTKWKLGDEQWITLDVALIDAIGAAVSAHVRACFAAEKTAVDAIEAGSFLTFADVEAAFANL